MNNNSLISTNESLEQIMDETVGISNNQEENKAEEKSFVQTLITDLEPNLRTSRFSSASWVQDMKNTTITVIGLGGIGSWTSLLLAKLDPSFITMYDYDTVEESNLGGQLYNNYYVGIKKTLAMSKILFREYYYAYSVFDKEYTGSQDDSDIIISCVDNMKSRKYIFNLFKERLIKNTLFIDGRMSAECFQIFALDRRDAVSMNEYETKYLFTDEEADTDICSYKQTSYISNMIASFIANIVVNFVANKQESCFRPVPAFIEYEAATMNLKIKSVL